MAKFLGKILFFLWPPFEAKFAQASLDKTISNQEEMIRKIHTSVKKALVKDVEIPSDLENLAKLVYESENKRRDTIESKSLAYMSSFSITISIAFALPALISGQWNIPVSASIALVIIYILGIVHLITAVYWSVIARQISGIALPNADQFISILSNQKWSSPQERILFYIKQAKYNEPILAKKANSLGVAESMFIRGLFLISTATIVSGTLLLFSGTTSKPGFACQIPNLAGMNQIAAEKMLLELGLQPVRTNQYSSNFASEVVISQNPAAGSLVQPCDTNVTITISLGMIPTLSPTTSPTNTPLPTKSHIPIAPSQTTTP